MATVTLDYIAAGGNRHPSAADWAPGLLAFGAGQNVALWDPDDTNCIGITALLAGHTDVVNAVKIFDLPQERHLITGGADKTIRIWTATSKGTPFKQTQCLIDHEGSINTVSILPASRLFATGSADGTIKVWDFYDAEAKLVQSISLKPRYLPLTSALTVLKDETIILAVAGTSKFIQVYHRPKSSPIFETQATLTGHEGWLRSLDIVQDGNGDFLLASASQDKYIRLWRFRQSQNSSVGAANGSVDPTISNLKKSLSNKANQVGSEGCKYNVTFEALLIGHEDWIYTARWAPRTTPDEALTLLSASADNSLAMWRSDESSGVWVCDTRLGEISAQKGSTTATGSTGGFWIGLWQPEGRSAVSLGRTGSWRRWAYDASSDTWLQQVGVSGHTEEVQGIAWSPDGSYLLSTGSDQTTRLFAEWKQDRERSWHEFARPQIHGYDLNCISSLTSNQFVSGADEKLLRVFSKPKAIDDLLAKLCGAASSTNGELPDAANIPVLGLSNKAISSVKDDETAVNGTLEPSIEERDAIDPNIVVHKSTMQLDHPPFEDHLARHTLWPEHEKLYGHGYEISAVATSHDGSSIATACKASSIDHAVIRLFETKEWREVKPSLTAHSLTVTSLAFSPDDRHLLSVGRDRQWAVFRRKHDNAHTYTLLCSNPKGHTRMILDCSWAPSEVGDVFATAGRDKAVRVWKLVDGKAECPTTISASAPVTAIAFAPDCHSDKFGVAVGGELGSIHIFDLSARTLEVTRSTDLEAHVLPSGTVNSLRWRPKAAAVDKQNGTRVTQLVAASNDSSVRIFNFSP